MEDTNLETDGQSEFIKQCLLVEHDLLAIFIEFPDTFEDYQDRVKIEYFIDDRHRILYEALTELNIAKAGFDYATVETKLDEYPAIREKVTSEFVESFYISIPSHRSIDYYIKKLVKNYQVRQLADIGVELYEQANGRDPNIGSLIATTTEKLTEITNFDQTIKLEDLTAPVILKETLYDMQNKTNGTTGVYTGFPTLDGVTSGFKPGELIVIAGRPAMGKSTFAMNICEYCGYINNEFNKPVVVFTLEMPAIQVMMRSFARIGTINQKSLQNYNLTHNEYAQLMAACQIINKATSVYIDDSSYGLTIEKLRTVVRRIAHEHLDENKIPQMGLVMVDYLQLLETEQNFRDRHLLIAHIAKSLKALAREFNCPVIALSQLNRQVDSRGPDARPTNADLRESGAIEQDADMVIMVHRPEVGAPPEKKDELKGKAEIIITKNRQGEIGTVYCRFEGQFSRFIDDDTSGFRAG